MGRSFCMRCNRLKQRTGSNLYVTSPPQAISKKSMTLTLPAIETSNYNTERSQRSQKTEKSHAKTQREDEFEQELTEVTEICVSSLSSFLEFLCLGFPRAPNNYHRVENRELRCLVCLLVKSVFVLPFAPLRLCGRFFCLKKLPQSRGRS